MALRTLLASGYFITTLLVFLGLPLLGWGLDGLAAFFSDPPRRAYAVLNLLLGVAVAYQVYERPEGVRGGKVQPGRKVGRQSVVRYALTAVMLGGLSAIPFCERHGFLLIPEVTWLRWAGVALFALGMGVVYWSGMALGRLYSPEVALQEGHHLVTSGPYRHIRHPRYLGGLVYALGLALLFRSWLALLLTLIVLAAMLFRIRDEEAFMQAQFGADWEAYCQRTWRLVPFLY